MNLQYGVKHNGKRVLSAYADFEDADEAARALVEKAAREGKRSAAAVLENQRVVGSYANFPIMATVQRQRFGPEGKLFFDGPAFEVDCTEVVLALDWARLRQLSDLSALSDSIAHEVLNECGPVRCAVEDAICEYFQLDAVGEITPELLDRARTRFARAGHEAGRPVVVPSVAEMGIQSKSERGIVSGAAEPTDSLKAMVASFGKLAASLGFDVDAPVEEIIRRLQDAPGRVASKALVAPSPAMLRTVAEKMFVVLKNTAPQDYRTGVERVSAELATPSSMPQDVYICLRDLDVDMERAAGAGEDAEAGFDECCSAIRYLLDAAPWTTDPDNRAVVKRRESADLSP